MRSRTPLACLNFALSAIPWLAVLAVLLLGCMACLIGCGRAVAVTPAAAIAPADPYATALTRLQVFGQVLQDASAGARNLHSTLIVQTDGTTGTLLDDATYARVQTGLRFAAAEGTTLSNLLAQRASAATITVEMARLTAGLAQQLSPDAVGIKNPQSQQRYVLLLNLVTASVSTLASQLSLLLPQEVSRGRSGNPSPRELAYGTRATHSNRDRAGAERTAPGAAGRSRQLARFSQCGFRASARYLGRHYA